MGLVELNGGHLWADEEFLPALVALRLDTLRGVFEYEGKGYLRTHANRDNFHIVEKTDGRTCDIYLKRHRGFELKEVIKLLAAEAPFTTAGRREWENIARLHGLGIPTMRRAAYGERKILFFEAQSFVITERIPQATPMDDYIARTATEAVSGELLREKRSLLWDLGDLARRLHRGGLTHMDLYLNHVFVRETASGEKVLHLIDLQRVARRRLFKRRWIVKDLAAILYSARKLPLSRTDFARIFMAYFDGKITSQARGLLASAMSRADKMAARLGR
jgi:heptose I phosphotransferase